MPLHDMPFWLRVVLLLAFAGAMLAWDAIRQGRAGKRRGEYLLLFAAGLIGAIVGVLNDLITPTISPEYFIFGKGIAPGHEFLRDVLQLGAQTGFSAGVMLAGILLFANSAGRKRAPLPMARIARLTARPLASVMAGAIVFGWIGMIIERPLVLEDLAEILTRDQLRRFLIAWSVHIGLYAGAVIGLILAMVRIVRGRRIDAAGSSEWTVVT